MGRFVRGTGKLAVVWGGQLFRSHEERESGFRSVLRAERVYGSFERSFTLGAPVRADQVKATFKDGVLEVRVPKAEEARLREIEVQVG